MKIKGGADSVPIPLPLKWILFFVFNGILGAGVMMLVKGTLPPPLTSRKAGPVLATTVFIIGMTGFLVFGEPDLLQVTINLLTGK
jgi:hypothetical protein